MRRTLILALAASALACPAGSPYDVPQEREPTEQVSHRAQAERFFIVTRPDFRKCAYPFCGGVFVAEVNREESTCYGDELGADCYVSELDLSSLGLGQDAENNVRTHANNGHVLVRGSITDFGDGFNVGKLSVKAAWQGATLNTPTGNWYQVKDTGIVCITFPCMSISQLTLNTGEVRSLGGLDLTASGGSDDDLALASTQIVAAGLMVSGTHDVITGPAGVAPQLLAAEFYLPIGTPVGEACGNTVCAVGDFCCNESCGICAPPGGSCIEIACTAQCAHSECNQGNALTTTCSDCATAVCEQDAFCCTDSWDGLCVQQAQQLCDVCVPPPPPACEHDVCASGASLNAACSPCAAAVCAADSFCCDNTWDALCVQQAEQTCEECAPAAPTCAHDKCAPGAALDASCSSCAAAVCDADAYCCDVAWDGICVGAAAELCDGC